MSDVSEAAPPAAATSPPPARRGRGRRTVADMVRSLVVVGAFVVLLVLIVPRPSAVNQPPVDVVGVAQGEKASAGFELRVPTGLSSEWRATSVRLINGTDNIQTWHVGYQTPSAQYAALEQAKDPTTNWVLTNTQHGQFVGVQDVKGQQWTQILHVNRLQRTLELVQDGTTYLVTGSADWPELGQLAASLKPAP